MTARLGGAQAEPHPRARWPYTYMQQACVKPVAAFFSSLADRSSHEHEDIASREISFERFFSSPA